MPLERCQHQQRAWELLAFCDRRIVVPRPVEKKIQRKPQTPAPADPRTIGEYMIKRRIETSMTQSQIAKQLGVAKSTVGNWEGKHCRPSGKVREQVVAWLGFDPETH